MSVIKLFGIAKDKIAELECKSIIVENKELLILAPPKNFRVPYFIHN